MWKIGNYFGSNRLSLGRTFLYGVTRIIKCLISTASILHVILDNQLPRENERQLRFSLDKSC